MRRLFLILLLAAMSAPAIAQNLNPNTRILRFAGVPSGPCTVFFLGINNSNNDTYNCNTSGAWVKIASGGGASGTVTAVNGTANQINSDGSSTTPTLTLSSTITLPGTLNKYTFTAPATGATFSIADGKTFTASNSLTLAGTDSTTQTFAGISGKPWSVISATVGNTDTVACPNNTTANFATTYTIPANYLVANKLLRVTLEFGMTTTATVPNIGFNLLIGGTNVFVASTANAATAGWVKVPMGIQFLVQGSAAASASAAVYTHPTQAASTGTIIPFQQAIATAIAQPVNLATNGTLVIQPQLFCSANTAGNSLTLQQFIVESD